MAKLIDNQGWQGNYVVNSTGHSFMFTICDKNGASVNYSGSPTFEIYKGQSTTTSFAGLTLGNVATGLYQVAITITDIFYEAGYDYKIVLSGITVDSESVNAVVGSFSIDNRT
jgi:hypothetical protein